MKFKKHIDVFAIITSYGQRKITGPNGKEADARNCILILTTNLGPKDAEKNNPGFGSDLERVYEDADLKNTLLRI